MTKRLACREAGFDCEFEVQSENEDEIIEFARQHAQQTHDMDLSRSQIEEHVHES